MTNSILNIYETGEQRREATIRKFRKVTQEIAKAFAQSEYKKYRIVQDRLFESDFDRHIKKLLEDG